MPSFLTSSRNEQCFLSSDSRNSSNGLALDTCTATIGAAVRGAEPSRYTHSDAGTVTPVPASAAPSQDDSCQCGTCGIVSFGSIHVVLIDIRAWKRSLCSLPWGPPRHLVVDRIFARPQNRSAAVSFFPFLSLPHQPRSIFFI